MEELQKRQVREFLSKDDSSTLAVPQQPLRMFAGSAPETEENGVMSLSPRGPSSAPNFTSEDQARLSELERKHDGATGWSRIAPDSSTTDRTKVRLQHIFLFLFFFSSILTLRCKIGFWNYIKRGLYPSFTFSCVEFRPMKTSLIPISFLILIQVINHLSLWWPALAIHGPKHRKATQYGAVASLFLREKEKKRQQIHLLLKDHSFPLLSSTSPAESPSLFFY